MMQSKLIVENRKVNFEYFVLETYEAGIVLVGSEVKSCIAKKVNLEGSFVTFTHNGVVLVDAHIEEYKNSRTNHEVKRNRNLLLHKREIATLFKDSEAKGLTVIPTKMYFGEKGKIKIEIALCKGKRNFDKRNSLKERDQEREMSNY